MGTVEGHATGVDVAAGPTRRHAAQVGVEEHVGVGRTRDADGQTLHGGVLSRERSANAGALEGEILLEQGLIDLLGGGQRDDGQRERGCHPQGAGIHSSFVHGGKGDDEYQSEPSQAKRKRRPIKHPSLQPPGTPVPKPLLQNKALWRSMGWLPFSGRLDLPMDLRVRSFHPATGASETEAWKLLRNRQISDRRWGGQNLEPNAPFALHNSGLSSIHRWNHNVPPKHRSSMCWGCLWSPAASLLRRAFTAMATAGPASKIPGAISSALN